ESILQKGDVITQVDEYKVDNDGRVQMYGLTLPLDEAVEKKQTGQTVELTFYRQGTPTKATATIALYNSVLDYARQYDVPPRYACYAGLVFVPLTRNLLETWGKDWPIAIPSYLRYLFYNSMQLNTDKQRKEYIVLAEIMPDQINSYSADFKDDPVESINGIAIEKLDDVYEAFKKPGGNFHIIKFMNNPEPLVLDAMAAAARQAQILSNYHIPADSRLEVK
ncbi:MAG: hypothetical protein Q7T18_13025, partial [Sedimentisphaerales bacterium]|nr:hypothetical protein [Sedimentisphaerales bacterium]